MSRRRGGSRGWGGLARLACGGRTRADRGLRPALHAMGTRKEPWFDRSLDFSPRSEFEAIWGRAWIMARTGLMIGANLQRSPDRSLRVGKRMANRGNLLTPREASRMIGISYPT